MDWESPPSSMGSWKLTDAQKAYLSWLAISLKALTSVHAWEPVQAATRDDEKATLTSLLASKGSPE